MRATHLLLARRARNPRARVENARSLNSVKTPVLTLYTAKDLALDGFFTLWYGWDMKTTTATRNATAKENAMQQAPVVLSTRGAVSGATSNPQGASTSTEYTAMEATAIYDPKTDVVPAPAAPAPAAPVAPVKGSKGSARKAAPAPVVNDTERATQCYGFSISQVARWYGYNGYSAKQALGSLAEFAALAPSAVVTGVSDGYSLIYGKAFRRAVPSKAQEAAWRKAVVDFAKAHPDLHLSTSPVRPARTWPENGKGLRRA